MTTISLLFIVIFILVQGALGIGLLYRGYKLVLESIEMENVVSLLMNGVGRLKAAVKLVDPTTGWRRAILPLALFIPGSVPLLLIIALWRLARRFEPGVQWSRLKTVIQNIAI
jgi:hypothetical protein